ncbi:MAG TPA: sugar transferase [Herpetosiphonaceae bacterium]|nr:sugar transferase [Herpetosiphonaceae bacterium]
MTTQSMERITIDITSIADRRPDTAYVEAEALDSRAQERAWLTLLEALPNCRTGQILYTTVFNRIFDFVGAAILLVLLSPLLLLVAIAIRLENRGPVLFRQPRVGRYGAPFVVWKFRTMIPDRRRNNVPYDGPERRVRHKSRTDPRVTRLGRLLRSTSIDELPQLVNVLRGEMSLVGPRPELPAIVAGYAPWQHQRHLVRPGITGWWQVRGRSDFPMHEHTELDIYYVAHKSLWFDLRILVETVRTVLVRSGAF